MAQIKDSSISEQFLKQIIESPNRVFVIGSRPNVGKTRIAISIARSNLQIRSLFLSYEHNAEFFHCLIESPDGIINETWNKESYHYDTGDITLIQSNGIASIGGRFLNHLHQRVREVLYTFLNNNPVEILWIDYIQLVDDPSNLLSGLRQLGEELGFKIVILSSMVKESEVMSQSILVPNGYLWSEQFASYTDEWLHLTRREDMFSVRLTWLNGERKNQSLSFKFDEQKELFN